MTRAGAAAVLAACVLAGCGSDQPAPAQPQQQVIDEQAGEYRGVVLGGSSDELRSTWGPIQRAGLHEPATPQAGEHYGPWGISYPRRVCRPEVYRDEYVAFIFNCGELLWLATTEPRAATSRGVAVGDPIAEVEREYAELRCGTAGGGEYESYPACAGKVADRRYIWFGGDPIGSITIGRVPLQGVSVDRPFTGETFELSDGEFVTFDPGEVERGDKIVCVAVGIRAEVIVPGPGTGVSTDPLYVAVSDDGRVRAECGGIHAETMYRPE